MRAVDADILYKSKFHPLPYTQVIPSDTDAESYKRGWNDAIDAIIENSPTIEPEPCDDPRADVYYLAEKIGIHRLYALVVELRGEPEPCEDAVSRKEVLNLFAHNCDHVRPYMDTWEAVKRLTPVTPKRNTGKWIVHYECPKCGEITKDFTEYCPFCNADMRG